MNNMEYKNIIATLVLFYMVAATYCQTEGNTNSPVTALGKNPFAGGLEYNPRPTPNFPGGRGMTPGLSANKLTIFKLLNPEFGGENTHSMFGMMFCHTCVRERNTLCMQLFCIMD